MANNFGYADLSNVDWDDVEDLQRAIRFHTEHLEIPYLDDQERNWTLRTIDALQFKLDKLEGRESDWVKLFK